ncbi:RNA-directed DNA polymerase [Micromonospora carbonacea]|uniref:RNA-directed DNA polymerase n=1 Tax=Micromonospora carbonacea TaxID=47853 RepID=UPI0037205AC4
MPDLIAFADTAADWHQHRAHLVRKILDEDYHPNTVEVVDLPKDRLMVRPLARLRLPQRLTYEAAVFAAASAISRAIPSNVYSYQWWRRERRFLAPTTSWLKMQKAARRLNRRRPNWLMAETDVTSFYEYVDVNTLIDDLSSLPAPKWSVDVLDGFLQAFNDLNNVSGIPQGPDASGLLANLYLRPLDLELRSLGLPHYRYSDDIMIFGPDWVSLRDAILRMTRLLRGRRLSLSAGKTDIIPGSAVPARLEDKEKDAITYGIERSIPGSLADLKRFFDRITSSAGPPSSRNLKFSFTQLRLAESCHAVPWLLNNLGEVPHLAREALTYLSCCHAKRPKIAAVVAESLANSKLVLYPYAQQHILIYMIHHQVTGPIAREAAWQLLLDRNTESFVREFAARYIGLNPTPGDGVRLRHEFSIEDNPRVRRALLVACFESGRAPDRFLAGVSKMSSQLRPTADYLLTAPKEIPLPIFGVRRAP